MAVAVERVRTKRSIRLPTLRGVGKQFLLKEIQDFTSQVALEENQVQMNLTPPNNPTRMIIDGSKVVDITLPLAQVLKTVRPGTLRFSNMKRSIRFVYTDQKALFQAVAEAWKMLLKLTPVDRKSRFPTRAISTYYFWLSDWENKDRSRKVGSLSQVASWIKTAPDVNKVSVHILGPTTEYRRTVIYRGRGRRTKKGKLRRGTTEPLAPSKASPDRKVGTQIKYRQRRGRTYQRTSTIVYKAIGAMVRDRLKPQFRDVRFGYGFVPSKDPLPVVHSPSWRPTGNNKHIPRLFIAIKYASAYGPRRR